MTDFSLIVVSDQSTDDRLPGRRRQEEQLRKAVAKLKNAAKARLPDANFGI